MSGKSPPAPTRGSSKGRIDDTGGGKGDDVDAPSNMKMNVQDLIPRINISTQLSLSLISELGDKNWKVSSLII